MRWYADISFYKEGGFSEGEVDSLDEFCSERSWEPTLVVGRGRSMGLLEVSVLLEGAGSCLAAVTLAQRAADQMQRLLDGGVMLRGVSVMDERALEQEIAARRSPELVSISEVAEMAGYTRQWAKRLTHGEQFPPPWVKTKAVTLWDADQVRAFFQRRQEPQPGRPRKTTQAQPALSADEGMAYSFHA